MKSYKSIVLNSTLALATVISTNSCTNTSAEETLSKNEYSTEENFDDNDAKDTQFLVHAADINREEISLGQLAQLKATMKNVQELGAKMEEEHTQSLTELTAIAKSKNISILNSQSEKIQEAYKKLNGKSGLAFDKEYCDMMVNGHKNAIDLFEKASVECKDDYIRVWANAALPALRSHLEHAIKCQEECAKM